MDSVRVEDLQLIASVADGAQWPSAAGAPEKQPILVSLEIPHDLRGAASADDISQSVNYGTLSRILSSLEIAVTKPRALPYVESVGITSRLKRFGGRVGSDRFTLRGLACILIVGLNSCEREDKQDVRFDLTISRELNSASPFPFRALGRLLREAAEATSFVSLESLASFVAERSLGFIKEHRCRVTVRASKPKALVFAGAAQVEVVRSSSDYYPGHLAIARITLDPPILPGPLGLDTLLKQEIGTPTGDHPKIAAIAIGSNVGDTFANIEAALRLLEDPALVSSRPGARAEIVNTSFLYETEPMYVADQPRFINGAFLLRTNIDPPCLLTVLKSVEAAVGRLPSIRNGPRAIDLDILLYDDAIIDTRPECERVNFDNLEGHLVVPHPRMAEREFVLRPLNDMLSAYVHPTLKKTIRQLLDSVLKSNPLGSPSMVRVIPFPDTSADGIPVSSCNSVRPTATHWTFPLCPGSRLSSNSLHSKTRIMATLNVTPDSFSDGATYNTIPAALSYAAASLSAGADIIDVGGYSTRPGAAFVTSDEETQRVRPVIEAIRASDSAKVRSAVISVDTFRPSVARAALAAGANCINDVYAFTGPGYPLTKESAKSFVEMRQLAREHAVPIVVMHSRGPAATNKDYGAYGNVIDGVTLELGEKVEAMVRGPGGVRRWLVIVDPGVGFSKTVPGNLDLIRNATNLTSDMLSDGAPNPLRGFPQLVGASRKSFLGMILAEPDSESEYLGRQTEPRERGWATAAIVACAVQQGVEVVRVHDVLELGDVVRIADRLWK
ncbi:Dihydropteroate synthase [Vararia minispora EC-137]|uniref:Dihydropteroate synthase n=1 Tax=Vararia minispora EC-137 TaxID=1314806 RepID=A0ACB8QK93_9AGAM|nr:Dihydropteroate synthase [Vararia minispora EC-137]